MLHEVLLALSGHPSPLFPVSFEQDLQKDGSEIVDENFPFLSSSEAALLEVVGKLAHLHRRIRALARRITSEHPSTICRAAASSILHTHLACFQKKILDAESRILTKDADLVGAYNIVPLSAVVGEFDEWSRRMEWYWKMVCFIQDPENRSSDKQATGAGLIDHLRAQSQTGFPDIELVSIELGQVAEKAWLKQLSVWLLYGQLPSHGASDFFVMIHESVDAAEGIDTYTVARKLLPKCVSDRTSDSLLFIGKSLHQVKRHRHGPSQPSIADGVANFQLLADHLQLLSSLTLPLVPSTFSTIISRIRSSLSQKVLQKLLPIADIELSLKTFRQFFLLERGEFAMTLIEEAQKQLDGRKGELGRFLHTDPTKNLQGVTMKEGEVTETLTRTWKTLTAAHTDDLDDETLEFAREHIRLETSNTKPTANSLSQTLTPFNDLLLPIPTFLIMHIHTPLDLFISHAEVSHYSNINAYLIALRRSHTHLADLWRLTHARRNDPKASATTRSRIRARTAAMRKVWATSSAALFLLSETIAYFEGEVIKGAWDHFMHWMRQGNRNTRNSNEDIVGEAKVSAQHDPETLATGHAVFLEALTCALLLTDAGFTKALRRMLDTVQLLVAQFTRLQQLRHSLDLDAESHGTGAEAVVDEFTVQEEKTVALELDRARKRVDSAMKDVVARLRQLDNERIGEGVFRGIGAVDGMWEGDSGDAERAFEAWRGGGVERLLMKVDFGGMVEGEGGEVFM